MLMSRVERVLGLKPVFREAGMLRQITSQRLKGEGLPQGLYTPGDAVIVEVRRQIEPGEIVFAEIRGREALYRHVPGAAMIRFTPKRSTAPGSPPIQIPISDLEVVGVVIGLRRAL
jgi:SOS-response transcriptional repressor LexA